MQKGKCSTHKLLRNAADAKTDVKLATHCLLVLHFSAGSPKEWFKFKDNLDEVVKGQDIAEAADRHTLCGRLLEGEALTLFNAEAANLGNKTAW